MEYHNQPGINIHAHLPIVFDCCDAIRIFGQLWSQEQPYMKFYKQVFLKFTDSSKPSQFVNKRYGLAWPVEIWKSDKNLHTNTM